MRIRMPCQTPGALCIRSWVCLASGGIAKRTMVPTTAINASIRENHAHEARNVAFVQPDDDRVKNHGEKKNDREEQNHRLKGPQKQPGDDEQKDEADDPPCAVITQRS